MRLFKKGDGENGVSCKMGAMACITTAHFSVIVNGNPTGYILPSRGLRQGDHLSPYLFLFCAEGLIVLLRKAETEGKYTG